MATLTAYLDSDNVITVSGLQNTIDDTYENTATVQVTLQDANGNEVAGDTWPLTMNYVSASNGIYRATLLDTLSVVEGNYVAVITANAGVGQYRTFYVDVYYVKG